MFLARENSHNLRNSLLTGVVHPVRWRRGDVDKPCADARPETVINSVHQFNQMLVFAFFDFPGDGRDREVSFYSSERGVGTVATLNATGAFSFTDPLEAGSYGVSITPAMPDPMPGKAAPKASASPIPRKYREAATSQLSYIVERGTNNFTIELKK